MKPLNRHDALIFDIDGTLWNASPASAKGWTRGLAKLGIDRTINVAFVYVSWGFGRSKGKPKTVDSFAELLSSLTIENSR